MMYVRFFIFSFYKELLNKIRYPINTVFGRIGWWVIFLLLFLGINIFGPSLFEGDGQVNLIKGYILWFMVMANLQEISDFISEETKIGTISFLFVQPIGFSWIVFAKVINKFIIISLELVIILFAIMLSIDKYVVFNKLYVVVVLVSMLSIWGWALILGGISLLIQKIDSIVSIISITFSLIAVIPKEKFYLKIIFPFSYGMDLIYSIDANMYSIMQLIRTREFIMGTVSSLAILLFGLFVFSLCKKTAIRKGIIGYY